MRQRGIEAPHGRSVGGAHLLQVADVDELREVIHDGRRAQMRARGAKSALLKRLVPELLVHARRVRPGGAPVVPGLQPGHHAVEVGRGHTVGGEPRTPVRTGGGDVFVHV